MMTLIEGIGNDVTTFFLILSISITIIFTWLSTNVRDFPFPANLLVIERRSRRLYTPGMNGHLNRIMISQHFSPSASTTTTINPIDINVPNSNQSNILIVHPISENNVPPSIPIATRNSIEIVDEIVEQALVENLLEGTFYTTSNAVGNQTISSTNNQSRLNEITSAQNTTSEQNNNEQTSVQTDNLVIENFEQEVKQKFIESENSDAKYDAEEMDILIRFVNQKEMKIKVKSEDTILLLKRTYFGKELSNNKIVRFIYQGQFLCDKKTIKSYNIKDQTTIHCHITSKKPRTEIDTDITNNTQYLSNSRQRIQNSSQLSTITSTTSLSGTNLSIESSISNDIETENEVNRDNTIQSTISNNNNSNTLNQIDNGNSTPMAGASIQNQNGLENSNMNISEVPSAQSEQAEEINSVQTILNLDISNFLLPSFAMLISSLWYFRINFKHFFSPLSTLILLIFTFVYGIFLINNIHSTTTMAAANLVFHNRIWRRRDVQLQN